MSITFRLLLLVFVSPRLLFEDLVEHTNTLEVYGFPVPSSLRVTGLDKMLTSVGLERGRLPHMYKVGSDTAAVTYLLLHGASRLSLDGFGAYTLPVWVDEDQRDLLYRDLENLSYSTTERRTVGADEKLPFVSRIKLQLLDVLVSPPTFGSMHKFATPMASSKLDWKDVSFRVSAIFPFCNKESTQSVMKC